MLNLFGVGSNIIVGIVVAFIILMLIISLISAYIQMRNALVRLRNEVEKEWSTIDVYLKKRYDLIPNLVETVKGYAKHESGTLEAVIAARNSAMCVSGENKIDAENQISTSLRGVFALAESYPDLKANTQFLSLQNELQKIESELAHSRKMYNEKVKAFNTRIELFPSNIVAHMMRLERKKYFETSGVERENVKVSF